MIVIHGEHIVASRQKLVQVLEAAKDQGREIVRLDAARLTTNDLESALGADSLFGTPKTLVIEELHSLPTSQKKKQLIELVAKAATNPNPEIVLWEKRVLTVTMLKPFPQARVELHKISSAVFTWLDSLSSDSASKPKQLKLFKTAVASEDAYMCLAMLTRQVRMLIQVKDGYPLKGAPFTLTKLTQQARSFTLPKLLAAHHRLLEIDVASKTSSSLLSLEQQLDLLVLAL